MSQTPLEWYDVQLQEDSDITTKTVIVGEFTITSKALPQLQALADTDTFWDVLIRRHGDTYWTSLVW